MRRVKWRRRKAGRFHKHEWWFRQPPYDYLLKECDDCGEVREYRVSAEDLIAWVAEQQGE